MRKLRNSKVKELACEFTANKVQSWNLNPRGLSLEFRTILNSCCVTPLKNCAGTTLKSTLKCKGKLFTQITGCYFTGRVLIFSDLLVSGIVRLFTLELPVGC